MIEVKSKQCRSCGEDKPLEDFSLLKGGKFGRHSHCKRCRSTKNSAVAKTRRGKDPTYIWPRPLTEQLIDRRSNHWRGPVTAGQLTWRV